MIAADTDHQRDRYHSQRNNQRSGDALRKYSDWRQPFVLAFESPRAKSAVVFWLGHGKRTRNARGTISKVDGRNPTTSPSNSTRTCFLSAGRATTCLASMCVTSLMRRCAPKYRRGALVSSREELASPLVTTSKQP